MGQLHAKLILTIGQTRARLTRNVKIFIYFPVTSVTSYFIDDCSFLHHMGGVPTQKEEFGLHHLMTLFQEGVNRLKHIVMVIFSLTRD